MKYSIIIPYIGRLAQLHNTLVSFRHHYGGRSDYEILLMEDGANTADDHDGLMKTLSGFTDLPIRYFRPGYASLVPVTAYNEGVGLSSGDNIILTNPEIFHAVDVLGGLDSQDSGCYVPCGCISLKDYGMFIPDMSSLGGHTGKWYQHSSYRNMSLNFCAMISRKNYDRIGGFYEGFKDGCCWADLDFVTSVRAMGIPIRPRDDLLTYHQDHASVFSGRRHRQTRTHVRNAMVYLQRLAERMNYATEPPPAMDELRVVSEESMQRIVGGDSRRYTICYAARDIYPKLPDEDSRLRLRYICTLAEYITNKVGRHDPLWMRTFYPRRGDFSKLMRRKG